MALFTSSKFASAAASGTDWRDTSKKVLEELESVKTSSESFNFGFLYISDYLANDATSILNLFRSVLGIEHWVGTVGIGICGSGEAFIDQPAISAMVGYFDPEDFCIFPGEEYELEQKEEKLGPWLEETDPMLVFVHGDPLSEQDPAKMLKDLEQFVGGFVIGGLSSSRHDHFQFAEDIFQGNLSGVAFSQKVNVVTALSQGCKPIGDVHTITRGDDHVIRELDSKKVMEVFENDLRIMAVKKIDQDPDAILIDEEAVENLEVVPEEFKSLFKGEVHVALPISESDQSDYLVRNIVGVDPDEGVMVISQTISTGESLIFVHRDHETVQEDLSKTLMNLRERVKKDTGNFEPKGAIYVSCVARASSEFENENTSEMKLIRDIIGDIPLAGFYAGGEISNARLYGYTGILTLFL